MFPLTIRASTAALLILPLALLSTEIAHADGSAAAPAYVIAPGQEKLFLELTDPRPGRFPGGFVLDEAGIERSEVALRYVGDKGQKAALRLAHPSSPGEALAQTTRFVLRRDGASPAPPAPLVEALVARLRARESAFAWTAAAKDAPQAKAPSVGEFPAIPDDASPAERLRKTEYPTASPAEAAELSKALEAARGGKPGPARDLAKALLARPDAKGSPWPARKAALLLRAAGDGAEAARILGPALVELRAGGATDEADRASLELAASYELAGQRAEAEKILAPLADRASGTGAKLSAPCARAAALTLLLQEGRAADVLRLMDPNWKSGPRCAIQLRMRAAISAGDDKLLDEAGAVAYAADPHDQDLLYLWGFAAYDKQSFQRACDAWDKLMAQNPNYAAVLGLYGTAYHVLGRLRPGPELDALIARARQNPDDVTANHLAGIGLYYQRKYAETIPFLEHVLRHNPEPRAGMYLAMSHFFTGDVDGAIAMLDQLDNVAHREPDIYYCRSLVWRFYDLPRAIREMQTFLDVFLDEKRPSYGQQKIEKAKDDLVRMKRGEVPSVYLAGQGSYTPPPRKKH